jgi:1-acyl-sn-glycerol-3-phosphate acyltransferase
VIEIRRKPWFEVFFSWHVRRRIAGRFASLRIHGLEPLREACARGPVLVVSNHTSWWDPLVMFDLSYRILRCEGSALMDAKNLRALPMMGWIGAFGVELGDPEDGERAVRYGAEQLSKPGRMVVVFPQGRERPVSERPLVFRPGAARMALLAPVETAIVPMAVRYEHGRTEKPDALIHLGEPFARGDDVEALRVRMETRVTELLAQTEQAIHAGEHRSWPVYIDGGSGPSAGERVLAGRAPRVHR